MTAMISWQDNPRYARIIQKIQGMGPNQRAIFDTAAADQAFASEAMQRHLAALTLAADKSYKDKLLALGKQRLGIARGEFDVRAGLAREKQEFEKGQAGWGTTLSAMNIPLAGYFGYKQLQRDVDEVEATKKFRKTVEEWLAKSAK